MTARAPGRVLPRSWVIEPTMHAVRRLVERFPELEFADDADARSVLLVAVRNGRLLRLGEVRRWFPNERVGTGGQYLYSPDLGALFVLKVECRTASPIAVPITVYPARPTAEFLRLTGGEP